MKTRLAAEITPEEAAELHLAFLGDLGERLLPGRFRLRVAWALEPGEALTPAAPAFDPERILAAAEHRRQRGAGLGARLFSELRAAAREHPFVAAVGSDHPELELAAVEEAFRRLEAGADAVFGPSEDGGYYLLALRREAVAEELFGGIAWSTPRVLAESLERCRGRGLETSLLPRGRDIDTPRDLAALAERLAAGDPARCPRTRAWLDAHGRLPEALR